VFCARLRRSASLGTSHDRLSRRYFTELDEAGLLEQALDRRLRRGVDLSDPVIARRMHRYLVSQGFDPSAITGLLRRRRASIAESL
jgi:hypothetical protein